SEIDLNWTDNSNNESGFIVQRSTDPTFATFNSDLVAANTTSFNETGLSVNTHYYFRVYSVNIAGPSAQFASANAATISASSVSGTVFHDVNGNGTKDTGESTLSGWRIYADLNLNSLYDAGEPYVMSDASGSYTLSLSPGNYSIAE